MRLNPISIVPYYGGKSRMSGLISDMLCRSGINMFVVPFGGGARDLLNTAPYPYEIYNDSSKGMGALIELLSNQETGTELIYRLYETRYDEEYFNSCIEFRNELEDNYLQETVRQFNRLLSRVDKEHDTKLRSLFGKQLRSIINFKNFNEQDINKRKHINIKNVCLIHDIDEIEYYENQIKFRIDSFYEDGLQQLKNKVSNQSNKWLVKYCEEQKIAIDEFVSANNLNYTEYKKLAQKKMKSILQECFYDYFLNTRDKPLSDEDKYKLATSTYVIYSQSRDGAGVVFSKEKYKTEDDYYKSISKLYDVMERLNGIKVYTVDAMLFFCEHMELIEREDVLFYCDPTYLKDGNIDEDDTDLLNEYNPGVIYKHYWDREQHKKFLELITSDNVRCKFLISNYDDRTHLYDSYLTGGKWKRLDVPTTTTISNGQNNYRVECLWYNY